MCAFETCSAPCKASGVVEGADLSPVWKQGSTTEGQKHAQALVFFTAEAFDPWYFQVGLGESPVQNPGVP